MNKQETIGAKGTVPGFRPLIGEERWCNGDFNLGSLIGGFRPFLESETQNGDWGVTRSPLPPPAVETFEAHGHIWYKHTPGDDAPLERQAHGVVEALLRNGETRYWHEGGGSLSGWGVDFAFNYQVIGYRFPEYPAVHTTSQQEQHVEKTEQSFQHCDQLKQQLTSIYNGWVHLPPETVAECIADVASVLYPTDAERCEAAFQRWWTEVSAPRMNQGLASEAWNAAWFEAKKSK